MTTQRMMEIALELAGLGELPFDSSVQVEGENIKRVLAGVDMGSAEILAARTLGYDCVARHHNLEVKSAKMADMVINDHLEKMAANGVPLQTAQRVMEKRRSTIGHSLHGANFGGAVSMARLLGMPYLGIHTPADLLAERVIDDCVQGRLLANPRATLEELVDELRKIREFTDSAQGPEIWLGTPASFAGKTLTTMAGGLGMEADEYKAYIDAGFGTFVVMHMDAGTEKALREDGRCNVIVTGHMPSDSLGFNQILDAWEKEGLEITRIGGLV